MLIKYVQVVIMVSITSWNGVFRSWMWRLGRPRLTGWSLIIALVLAMADVGLLGQQGARAPAAGPPLSLQTALDEALARNPELVALRREFEAAQSRPDQQRFFDPPTFETQIWQWPINTVNPVSTNMYMFMFSQRIPGRGKRELRAAVAEKDVALAENSIAVRARQVIERVKHAWADLYLTRQATTLHHANFDLLRQFADTSSVKYEAGRISQQDVLKAVVELSKLQNHLVTLQQQERLSEATLNSLLDRPPDAAIGPVSEPATHITLPPSTELQRLALERQPEVRAATLAIERAEVVLEVVRSDSKPDFVATGGYMLMPGRGDAWMAKIGITWPTAPWSRGKLDARKAQAAGDLAAARARKHATETAVRLAVHQAFVRVQAAQERASLLEGTIVPLAGQTVQVSLAGYQTDRVDFLSLLDNQRVSLDQQFEYYRALSDREQALADLERAVGTDDIARLGRVGTKEVK